MNGAAIVKYALMGWWALTALAVVTTIGKPRGPVTPGLDVRVIVISAIQCALLYAFWDTH